MDTDSDGGFTITINLGETTHKMTQVIEHEPEEDNAQLIDAS